MQEFFQVNADWVTVPRSMPVWVHISLPSVSFNDPTAPYPGIDEDRFDGMSTWVMSDVAAGSSACLRSMRTVPVGTDVAFKHSTARCIRPGKNVAIWQVACLPRS